ncbi:nitroreductase/quinone reductase family protein [Streptomyces sp. UNOC14_S4]|uniref:nitroreductase/quinone reductase family protein n=1 Tax=Streptomyces sp. UNOC14_S4 TaxID=2872340 RepID=UPI001E48703C|nr:nitroreductase/quinone reductase family protein [Streptomyces sp. UNOC14_S4]MCC3768550.1 nitroreductase family deazaflavin-dependent oxidoreductase [Streptomyces sp. UNOC14_S4]
MTNSPRSADSSPAPSSTAPSAVHNSNPFNRRVIEEFRRNAGRVGGQFAGTSLLLLTTRGARSGLPRTTPLVHLRDGDRLLVFASNGGAPVAPAWFHNLTAAPDDVVVEVGTERYPVRARLVDESEHDAVWARQIAVDPQFADFRERARQAGRTTPVVALERIS